MPRSYRGVPSAEDFSTTLKAFSGLPILAGSIGSAAFVPGPTVTKKLQFLLVGAGASSGQALGNPSVNPGGRSVLPVGIATQEALPVPRTLKKQAASPSGIATAYASGTAALTPDQFALPGGVATGFAGGAATLIRQPILTSANHAVMDPLGGHAVTLTGQYLTGVTAVYVGGTSCAFSNNTGTNVTFTTPAKTYGNYAIVVVTAGGTSNQLSIESWDPTQDVYTRHYWDARYGLSLTGSSVNAWTDRKRGIIASAAGSARPARVAAALGVSAGIAFDGVDDGLQIQATNFDDQSQNGFSGQLLVTFGAVWLGKWPLGGDAWGSGTPDPGEPILGDVIGESTGIGMQPKFDGTMHPIVIYKGTAGGYPVGGVAPNKFYSNTGGSWAAAGNVATTPTTPDNATIHVVGYDRGIRAGGAAHFYVNGTLSPADADTGEVYPSHIGRSKNAFFGGTIGFILTNDWQNQSGPPTVSQLNARLAKIRDWAQVTFGAA